MDLDTVRRRLEAELRADGGEDVALEERGGPLGTRLVLARARAGAYPGQNRRTAVLLGAAIYAPWTGLGLASLLRAAQKAPTDCAAAELVTLYRFACTDGSLVVDEAVPPSKSVDEDGVTVRFRALDPQSGESSGMELRIPNEGPEALRAAPAAGAELRPISSVVALQRALDDSDAMALLGAIGELMGPPTDQERTLLAQVATIPNEALASAALERLGPDSAPWLRRALAADPEASAHLLRLAGEHFGDAFAESLQAER